MLLNLQIIFLNLRPSAIDNQFFKQLHKDPFLFLGSQGDFWTNAIHEKYFDGCQIDSMPMRTDPDFGKNLKKIILF